MCFFTHGCKFLKLDNLPQFDHEGVWNPFLGRHFCLRPNSHRTRDATRFATPANGTYCCQWECSYCMQTTSKEKCSNLRVRREARPVWIRPKVHHHNLACSHLYIRFPTTCNRPGCAVEMSFTPDFRVVGLPPPQIRKKSPKSSTLPLETNVVFSSVLNRTFPKFVWESCVTAAIP